MCSRKERIQKDVDVVIQRCKAENKGPFTDFRYADATFTFTYSQGSKTISYSVNVSDDYPDNTYVSNSENADDVLITSDTIPVIFHRIAAEMRPNDAAGETNHCRDAPGDSDMDTEGLEDDSDGESDFYDGGQEEEDNIGDEIIKHPQLDADLQAVRDLKGPHSASFREYGGFDDVDIDLFINVGFLDEETALAWGVMRLEPVTIKLNCSLTQYLDGAVPKVDVYQVSKLKDRFGLGHQLKKIVQTFVTEQWEQKSSEGEAPCLAAPTELRKSNCAKAAPTALSKYDRAKATPARDRGFLVQVIEYVEQRIPSLNEFCVICDEPHVFINGPMLRPYVCERELCIFAFQTLGVMNKVTDVIATGAQVVDLLVSMARSALASNRRDVIFEPYPSVVDPDDPQKLAFDPKNKVYERVTKALESLPRIEELTQTPHSEMKDKMDKIDKLSLPLLQWVISSNRSYISKLPPNKQLEVMSTPHQFLLLSSSPAKENIFRAAKEKFGSTFAFHGSHIENWHSILRNGLVVASNTKLQMNGAAYGAGIYISPASYISFGYSGIYNGHSKVTLNEESTAQTSGKRFLHSRNLKCIALCEVVTSPDLHKHGDIWVAPNADHVCTRFFFVYEDGKGGDPKINTQDSGTYKKILQIVTSRHQTTVSPP